MPQICFLDIVSEVLGQIGFFSVRNRAIPFRRLLCRKMCRLLEMSIAQLKIVAGRHQLTVAQPGGYDVQGKDLGQLGLPAGPQVLERSGPGPKTRPLDDLMGLGPKVGVLGPVARDDVFVALLGLLKAVKQIRPQL